HNPWFFISKKFTTRGLNNYCLLCIDFSKPDAMEIEAGEVLKRINKPADLKQLDQSELVKLCGELRQYIIVTVSVHGWLFTSSIGVVELIVALHYKLNTPNNQ